jgi:peptidoglycan hydrolase-like protein with peptidoglycan-binding domain
MRRTTILRGLVMLVAALVLAAGAISVTLQSKSEPTLVEAAAPDVPAAPTTTTTVAEPTTTSTVKPSTTSSTSTTVPAPTVPTTTAPTVPTVPTAPAEPQDGTLRRGDGGAEVLALQNELRALGYWLGTADGTYGYLTEQAVSAFQKVEGLSPDGVTGPNTRGALAEASRPSTPANGNLIEIDKGRQVLFVVRDGKVTWTLNVSTGTERPYQINGRTEMADTPPGRWTVDWVVDGVDVGDLGALYRPRYFHHDGIAVHGYHSVPNYPASHGCVRVTEAAMDWIWAQNLMPMGSAVWVH